ncbi:hypothetical protein KFK09_028745 [Dendrobium nobile]|uniref:Uncharacterized protein n=1 Tax=Dendrobium nobile TaxID=94219 RepID=A0A8T3A3I4_DENNO|nr:hypothetical protein KFK09_028745 [Dendrobium nobile]
MLKYTPACFTCASATSKPAAPTETTSFYATHLGNASITWQRRAFLGLSLLADLQLSDLPTEEDESGSTSDHLHFRLSILLPFKRKGSKRLRLHTAGGRRCSVELVWDLSRAIFTRECGPEPVAGFFFAIAVNEKVLLVAGDRRNEAYRRIKAVRPRSGNIGTEPILKRAEVKLGEIGRNTSWTAMARFGGQEREVLISIDLEKKRMRLAINGEMVLQVNRLRWKFRGSERVATEGGDRIQVSWDLYRFLFRPGSGGKELSSPAPAKNGDAVIVLRFENSEDECFRERGGWGYFGKSENWSEGSSSRSWTTGTSSQSLEDWESLEDARMRNSDADGFTLVICARKG